MKKMKKTELINQEQIERFIDGLLKMPGKKNVMFEIDYSGDHDVGIFKSFNIDANGKIACMDKNYDAESMFMNLLTLMNSKSGRIHITNYPDSSKNEIKYCVGLLKQYWFYFTVDEMKKNFDQQRQDNQTYGVASKFWKED